MANTYFPGRLQNSQRDVATVTTTATLTNDNCVVLADATGGAFTITLPAAASFKNKNLIIKKKDSTNGLVTVAAAGSDLIDGFAAQFLFMQYETMSLDSDGTNWYLIDAPKTTTERLFCRTLIDLTVVATTTLLTVPTARTLKVSNVIIEGQTVQSGGTTSVLKVGDTTAYSLLNGSSGHSFTSGTATTLLAVGNRLVAFDLYPPSGASTAPQMTFAAAKIIGADVSGGTPVTAGKVYVELYGYLL